MATFTQDTQPYGPLCRRSYAVGRDLYTVVRGDLTARGREWKLHRGSAVAPVARVWLPERTDDFAIERARRWLLP